LASKATEMGEIMHHNGHYAIHSHSTSVKAQSLVPIESPYAISY